MKKTWLPFVTLLLAAALASAQEPTPPPEGGGGGERQFAGEVVAVDAAAQTITVRASGTDANGEPVEKTLTLPVAESAAAQLESCEPGDKVTVLWRRDDAEQRDVVTAIAKAPGSPEAEAP
jgi:hypothetical protein